MDMAESHRTGDDDFDRLLELLAEDVNNAVAVADQAKDEGSYRAAVRTIFAGAEGVIWYLKAAAHAALSNDFTNYSIFELAALQDMSYVVRENGVVASKPNFIPLSTSIRLLAKLLNRGRLTTKEIGIERSKMDTIEHALKIRHRLTHPKTAAELEVNRTDYHAAFRSWMAILVFGMQVSIELQKRSEFHSVSGANEETET